MSCGGWIVSPGTRSGGAPAERSPWSGACGTSTFRPPFVSKGEQRDPDPLRLRPQALKLDTTPHQQGMAGEHAPAEAQVEEAKRADMRGTAAQGMGLVAEQARVGGRR